MGIFTGGWNPFRTPIREAVGGITGSPYLAGKEGWLPDLKLPDPKIKGVPVSEVFSAEGYRAGGEWYRKAATSRAGAFAEGLFGTGKAPENGDKDDDGGVVNWFKQTTGYDDFERWMGAQAESGEQAKAAAAKFYEDMLAKGEEGIDLSGIVQIPKIDIPEFPTFDMAGFGAGIGAGLAGIRMPEIPRLPAFTDEKGDPNLLMIGVLAVAGYGAVYLMTKR